MARQEELFAQTIMDMKRVLQRPADESESDDTIDRPTNRGNKLKRKARFVQEGRLDLANPYSTYKKRIKYNGYERTIISRNTLRVDVDGDVVDDDEDNCGSDVEDLHSDPYRDVDLLGRLMPLTSAAELKGHPSLSLPYTERHLEEIIRNAQEMVQREQNALWRMKQLAMSLRGDSAWVPVETFESEDDINLIMNGITRTDPSSLSSAAPDIETATVPSTNGIEDGAETSSLDPVAEQASYGERSPKDVQMSIDEAALATGLLPLPSTGTTEHPVRPSAPEEEVVDAMTHGNAIDFAHQNQHGEMVAAGEPTKDEGQTTGNSKPQDMLDGGTGGEAIVKPLDGLDAELDAEKERNEDEDMDETMDDNSRPHRMTTRAKAQAANSPTASKQSSPDTAAFVDPFFQIPHFRLPGRDLGLPYDEADETRRLMSAYIQKQEEVVRSSWRLYSGLLKAKRLRDDILEWCTAEGHVGEMSDGEDWYDKEKWGLTEDLEKGKEVEEEEVAAPGKKPTRNRRNVA